jgi:hypothetical protein
MALILTFAGSARAQAGGEPEFNGVLEESFVLFQNGKGETVCRVASPAERERLRASAATHVIYRGAPQRRKVADYGYEVLEPNSVEDTSGLVLLPSAGLTIVLQGTAQLDANPAAKAAFITAANRWESIISTPITVTLSVDFGTQFFGKDYGSTSILGQTGSFVIKNQDGGDPPLSVIREHLISGSNATASELQLYNALPTDSVPAEYNGSTVGVSNVRVNTAQARAIGFNVNPPADAQIGFNSTFGPSGNGGQFDFDPSDGITAGYTDFDAVVVHEIGHALGFNSANGGSSSSALTIWDLFRFRPTASFGNFTTLPRVLTKGGAQVQVGGFPSTFAYPEISLSTGGTSPPEGDTDDGRQSSHWKADELVQGRPYIGIMDPTLARGLRRTITENDIRTIDLLGYSVVFNPARPANDNFADASTLAGAAGAVTGTNAWATREDGEYLHAGFLGDKSVWYNWTAPTTGTATFDTAGSGFNTTLAVYRATAVNAVGVLASNNDDPALSGGASRVTFETTAGTLYRIAVDGWNGEYGEVRLNWASSGTAPTPTPVPSYSVLARVVDPDGSTLVNVTVALEGPTLTNGSAPAPTFSNADGYLKFTNLTGGGSYTVRPNDPRYTFSPASVTYNNIGADQGPVYFTATSVAATIMSGTVSEGGKGLAGVSVALYGFTPYRILKQTTTDANGRYTFTGQTVGQQYNFVFLKSGYAFTPPSLFLSQFTPTVDLGDVPATKTNQIERSDFFVTQHYRDFLGRDPDASGLAFWTNEIESCGFDVQCRQVKRINVSAAFFLSIEFQQTGYLVYKTYRAAYGDAFEAATALNVPVIRREEFMQDAPLIGSGVAVGVGDWQAKLEANKAAYMLAFVQRQRFTDIYGAMTPAQFVDRLNQNAGQVLTDAERASLTGELTANNTAAGRASVLRKVAENAELDRREKNRAFVLMEYYGYLRRNPNDAPEPNLNFAGWNFWLSKLIQFNGNYVEAEMVKAFLDSTEYRQRFVQ